LDITVKERFKRAIDLSGFMGKIEGIEEPIVEGTMIFELQGADRMGNPFDGIALAVSKIVQRIDAPGIPGAMVGSPADPVEYWIPQVEIGRVHVDFSPQYPASVREFSCTHPSK
jgi:hypothetical protein